VTLAVADRIPSSDQGQSVIENDGMPVKGIAGVLIHQVPEVILRVPRSELRAGERILDFIPVIFARCLPRRTSVCP
jgi:hypothetical protein